ncbi:flagellar hook protein FlgE [Rhodoferax saidenbachensis]|uniref:Flagellar hook protein FlgE n=1 Tax=Rhodoferax saidenbachensis TaxID=1484693 RepID=A0ABU1ZSL9_9BURK|nr:flagellar hook protein FlgE [Rhodoferax saidenbachensis]MDR7308554.1 flagellar hook protein FlgE [Rhodoferax saidenbachensis]
MSFQTGLSGLNVSSKSLDVIGNNIANSSTVGFKSSRNEFSELVAGSLGTGGGNAAGIGAATAAIAQQFSQGNINITGNSLDVGINGGGFFQVTKTDGTIAYTRDGEFKLDKTGNLITNTGSFLMGYPTDNTGTATSITPQKLVMPTGAPIPAKATVAITAEFNLDARAKDATQAVAAGVTPSPRATYGTSISVYDAQGVASSANLYFQKTDTVANSWDVYTDLTSTTPIGTMTFDATGKVTGPVGLTLTIPGGTITSNNPNEATGFIPGAMTVDISGVTQFGAAYSVTALSQDGYAAGEFTSLAIDGKGVISTSYSNGQTLKTGGMIALGDFRNLQGLAPVGGGEYLETFKSGPVVLGKPGIGKFGETRAGSIEESNVDITAELVNMMTAQRNYQANAQTIKTQDQVMSTLVNLR